MIIERKSLVQQVSSASTRVHGARNRTSARNMKPRQLCKLVLLFSYLAWFSLIASGVASYEGEPIRVTSKELPLHYFDVIFRRFGALLLFALWTIRATMACAFRKSLLAKDGTLLRAFALYTIQSIIRMVVYQLHVSGYIFTPKRWARDNLDHPPHIMSDHVLLGSAVMGGCACEATLSLLDLWAFPPRSLQAGLAKVYAAAATVLAALVSCECYFTSRYFHPPSEIILGVLIGFVLFQVPLLLLSFTEMERLSPPVTSGIAAKLGSMRTDGAQLS